MRGVKRLPMVVSSHKNLRADRKAVIIVSFSPVCLSSVGRLLGNFYTKEGEKKKKEGKDRKRKK